MEELMSMVVINQELDMPLTIQWLILEIIIISSIWQWTNLFPQTFFDIINYFQYFTSRPSTHGYMIFLTSTGGNTIHGWWMTENFIFRNWKRRIARSFFERKYSPSAAAVQWAIMKPEFNPPSRVKNAGKPLIPRLTNRSIRHSLTLPISWIPIAR